jgi:hypothetical protein
MSGSTSVSDVRDVASVLAMLGMVRRIWSPWAILLTCFQDDPPDAQLTPKADYDALFTDPAGAGKLNVVRCFGEMSHGKLDLSGSKVFGWLRLPAKHSDWAGNVVSPPAGKLNRYSFFDLAKATAMAAGVPLSSYAGVCVAPFGPFETWGFTGQMKAVCDGNALTPSIIGQEMGHGYGLDHARVQGNEILDGRSDPDYQDPWDLMSTPVWGNMMAPYPDWTHYKKVGPGLNAWNMRSRRWLNEARVWSPMDPNVRWEETVALRPLHQPNGSDWLAADLGPYLVEMRVPERWDAAIPHPCVLVHRFSNNQSYLQRAINRRQDLAKGDGFVTGDRFAADTYWGHYELEVQDVDAGKKTATVHLRGQGHRGWQSPNVPFRVSQIVAAISGHRDALLMGEDVIGVPTEGPVRELVEQIARYLRTEVEGDVAAALSVRRTALTEIVQLVAELYHEAEATTEPPIRYDEESSE